MANSYLMRLEEQTRRLLIAAEETLSQCDKEHNQNPDDCLRCYAEDKLRTRCAETAELLKRG